jgi:hypothetical protein
MLSSKTLKNTIFCFGDVICDVTHMRDISHLTRLNNTHNIFKKKFQFLNLHDTKFSEKRQKSEFSADLTMKIINLWAQNLISSLHWNSSHFDTKTKSVRHSCDELHQPQKTEKRKPRSTPTDTKISFAESCCGRSKTSRKVIKSGGQKILILS